MNLTDGEIAVEMAARRLVPNGEPAQLGPACYKLRMGNLLRSHRGSPDSPLPIGGSA
jgi:hypothetical protein